MASYFDEGKLDSVLDNVVALADGYGQTGVLAGVSTDGYAWTLTKLRDGYGIAISSTGSSLNANVTNTVTIAGTVTASNFPTTVDTNYGTVGANTLRSAAQIGNATGAADFNRGANTTQTLRVSSNLNDGYGIQLQSTSGSLNVNLTNTPTVNQGTSPWVVSGTVTAAEDKNFGTVGANTLRSAAQIGNATGAADFNFGASSAQTLRAASLVGNASGLADFNRGANSAQTLRATSNTNDGYGTQISSTIVSGKDGLDVNIINSTLAVTQSTSPWVVSGTITAAEDKNYGTVGATTLRTAAQIGNATGGADFNRGATGAQTLRTNSNLNDGYGTQISSTIVGGKDGLDVNIINSSTNQGLYAEDSVHVSGDLGQFALAVRNDADTVLTSTDGDYSPFAVDGYGHIKVDLYDGYGYPQNKITSQSTSTATSPRRGLDAWTIKGTPQHFNGTVGTSPTTLTPPTPTTAILISNPASNTAGVNLFASFDGGTTFFTIERRGTLSIEAEVSSFQVKASAASSNYEVLVTRR